MSRMAVINDTRVTLKGMAGLLIAGSAVLLPSLSDAADPRDVQEPNILRELVRPGSDLHLDKDAESRARANGHFATGLIHELNRKPDEALEQFYKAAAADPSREKLVITVADRFLRKRQPERALEILERAGKSETASGRIHGLLGFVYSQLGKPRQAIESIRRAIKETPDELPPYIFLAKAHRESGELAESLQALRDAMEAVPRIRDNLLNVSDEALRIPNTDKAVHQASRKFVIGLLDKIELDDMRNAELLDRLAVNYQLAGAAEKAIGVYVKAVELYPDSTQFRLRLADLSLQNEKWELAEVQLNFLIGERPEAAGRIHVQLAHIAIQRKDYKTAETQYTKALQFEPDEQDIHFELARLQAFEDMHEKALKTLANARRKFPVSFSMEYTASIIHNQMEKHAEAAENLLAAEILAKAGKKELLTPVFYHEMGSTFERGKQYRNAETYFRKVFAIEPEFADSLNYLGYMWTELEINLPEAKVMIEKAVKQEPENAAFLDSMAWALHKLKRHKEALDWQLKAVKFAEIPDAVLFDHLGDIYAGLNRMKEAQTAWEKALKLKPDEAIEAKLRRKIKRASSTDKP